MALAYAEQDDASAPPAGLNETVPPADLPGSTRKSSTSPSARYGAISPQAFVHALMLECAVTQYQDVDVP